MQNLLITGRYYGFPGDSDSLILLFNTRESSKAHSTKREPHRWKYQRQLWVVPHMQTGTGKQFPLPTLPTEAGIPLTISICRVSHYYRGGSAAEVGLPTSFKSWDLSRKWYCSMACWEKIMKLAEVTDLGAPFTTRTDGSVICLCLPIPRSTLMTQALENC